MVRFFTVGGVTLDDTVLPSGQVRFGAPGGNAVYSAIGAKVWSENAVGIVSKVSREYPEDNLAQLREGGIDTRGISRVDQPDLHVWILYERSGHRQIIHQADSGQPPEIDPTPEQVPPEYLDAEYVHMSCMAPESMQAMALFLVQHNLPFSLDIAQVSIGADASHLAGSDALRQCDVFLPSIGELEMIWGKQSPHPLLNDISNLGPKVTAVKFGERGSIVYDARLGRRYHIPIVPVETVDSTGAGDGYCGGFAISYCQTGDALEAALRATVSASFVVQDFGALHALHASRMEAQRRLDALRREVVTVTSNLWPPEKPALS